MLGLSEIDQIRRNYPSGLKGRFAQLLEQNPGFLYKVDTFLGLPCIRNRFIGVQFSKYDFWTPGKIWDRHR